MAVYTNIDNPGLFFNTVLYTGNATDDRTVTGVGFQPDWLWIKNRTDTEQYRLQDAVRGATKNIKSSGNGVEETTSNNVKSFDSDGFTLGVDNAINGNGDNMVSWNWKANGAGSANTDGSINSTVSVNTTAGFSIVSYTGNSTAGATIGHGLGVVPSMIIVKSLASSDAWYVYHPELGATKAVFLNLNNAATTSSSYWNDTAPTSSVFSVAGDTSTNNSGGMIAYCFSEIQGYSKYASYKGNANADGTFVYTGFKPAWVMIKRTDSADNWMLYDNKRDTINPQAVALNPDTSGAEFSTSNTLDFLSNGFKLKSTEATTNASGGTFIFMAFAENPFVTAGTKAAGTAR